LFSLLLFGLAWLMPSPSNPNQFFWQLWLLIFWPGADKLGVWLTLLGTTFVFFIAAVFLGLILQFVWAFFFCGFLRREK